MTANEIIDAANHCADDEKNLYYGKRWNAVWRFQKTVGDMNRDYLITYRRMNDTNVVNLWWGEIGETQLQAKHLISTNSLQYIAVAIADQVNKRLERNYLPIEEAGTHTTLIHLVNGVFRPYHQHGAIDVEVNESMTAEEVEQSVSAATNADVVVSVKPAEFNKPTFKAGERRIIRRKRKFK